MAFATELQNSILLGKKMAAVLSSDGNLQQIISIQLVAGEIV
jgi:hypothetical protein